MHNLTWAEIFEKDLLLKVLAYIWFSWCLCSIYKIYTYGFLDNIKLLLRSYSPHLRIFAKTICQEESFKGVIAVKNVILHMGAWKVIIFASSNSHT